MGIRKKDLSKFITEKAQKRKNVLWEAARVVVSRAVKPGIYEKYKEFDEIERLASRLHDAAIAAQERHKRLEHSWDYKNTVRGLNSSIIGFRNDVVRNITSLMLHNLLQLGTNGLGDEIEALVPELKKKLSKTISEYKTLSKLTEEVLTVIDSCRNGYAAYKRLEELGVDLSGFAVATPNLPAVIKLSGNVCVLNGDCDV